MLRHFFGTNLREHGVDIDTAKELLGHTSRSTTEIYWHVKQDEKKRAIEAIDIKPTFLGRVSQSLFGQKHPAHRWREVTPRAIQITPMQHGLTDFHVGRKKELETLHDLSDKQVNTLIFGQQGIGKSHLLDNYNHDKIIRIDDLRQPRRVLGGMLLELFNGEKEEILKMLTRIGSEDEFINKVANRESIKRLTELAIDVTQPKEYTIVIDDLTDITKIGVRILEKLKTISISSPPPAKSKSIFVPASPTSND
jgi:integrase/recombinase XerD